MSAAVDKARFHLEQCVPELRELESKKIFDRKEIQAVNRRRSDFEHKVNAPGTSPTDWARYLEYEFNLDALRRKRAKRMGARVTKHSGPRRIFGLLDRATAKFQGDLGLWMQYLDYAKRQRAFKKVSTVWTKVVRLHPTKPELWVEAGRYSFDDQSDMVAARSYMQRGLRFCQKSSLLWHEYFRLETDYLSKVSARAKSMGLLDPSKTRPDAGSGEENDDWLTLPELTADDAFKDEEGREMIGSEALQALSKSPALSGAIPMAIFDAAMQALGAGAALDLAADMFETAVDYDMPSRQTILEHISTSISTIKPSSASAQVISLRIPVISTTVNTAAFARSLAAAIAELTGKLSVVSAESEKLHFLSARWIASFLTSEETLDSGIREALQTTFEQVVASYQRLLEVPDDVSKDKALGATFDVAKELCKLVSSSGAPGESGVLLDVVRVRWPNKSSILGTTQDLVLANRAS